MWFASQCTAADQATARVHDYIRELVSEYGERPELERGGWQLATIRGRVEAALNPGWLLYSLVKDFSDVFVDFVERMEPHECVVV